MGKNKYPVGYKFNKLTVLEFLGQRDKSHHSYYKCKCECGNEIVIRTQYIQVQKSCGCAPRQMRIL